MEDLGEVSVVTHPEAVAADVDDVAVVQEPVDKRSGHDLIAEDLPPLLKALVGREYGGCALVAAIDELEEEHGSGLADRQVTDLVDDQERGIGQRLEPMCEPPCGLCFFQRCDEVGQGAVVDTPAALRGLDGETDREMRLPDTGRTEKDDVFLSLEEAELVERIDLLALDRGLEAEIEVLQRFDAR